LNPGPRNLRRVWQPFNSVILYIKDYICIFIPYPAKVENMVSS
jgi:hypothetical protein